MHVNSSETLGFKMPPSSHSDKPREPADTKYSYLRTGSQSLILCSANPIGPEEFDQELKGFFTYLDKIIYQPLQNAASALNQHQKTRDKFTVDDATEFIKKLYLTNKAIIKKLNKLLQVQFTNGSSAKDRIIRELNAKIGAKIGAKLTKRTTNTQAAEITYINYLEAIKSVVEGTDSPQ